MTALLTKANYRGITGFLRSLAGSSRRTALAVELGGSGRAANGGLKVEGVAGGVAVPVSGTVAVTGVATEATLAVISARGAHQTRSDAYTGAANGTAVVLTYPLSAFGLLVKGTGGTPTIWDIRLEGSLDGTNYQQIIAHTNADGDGVTKWSGTSFFPCLWFRSRSAGAITLGTASDVVARIIGVPL